MKLIKKINNNFCLAIDSQGEVTDHGVELINYSQLSDKSETEL